VAIDAILAPPPALQPAPSARAGLRQVAADVSVPLALLWWATGLTWATGGRDPHVLSVALVLLALAAGLVRPWRTLPVVELAAAVAVGAAAFAVTAVAPTGWDGASAAASWTYAAALLPVVRAWATPGRRRDVLLLALVAGPLLSFARGWTAWWGGEDARRPFVGTFYWHNQQAVFLALGTVAGLVLALVARRAIRGAGWLAVALCGAGVVVSTSRAALAALVLGLLALGLVALTVRAWRVAACVPVAALLVAGTSWLLTGPPFFAHRVTPLAGTEARAATGQSLAANGGHRLDDWRWAGRVFEHWPLTGTGFHGFAAGSKELAGSGSGSLTPYAHNGFLQLLVDGGLLLAVPVLLALALLAVAVGGQLLAARRTRDWTTIGAAAALLVLAAHSAVDFDWGYPALLSAFALTAALAVPARSGAVALDGRGRSLLGALALGLLALAAVAAWSGGLVVNVPLGGHA
jgi:O-antigen ligase